MVAFSEEILDYPCLSTFLIQRCRMDETIRIYEHPNTRLQKVSVSMTWHVTYILRSLIWHLRQIFPKHRLHCASKPWMVVVVDASLLVGACRNLINLTDLMCKAEPRLVPFPPLLILSSLYSTTVYHDPGL